MRCRLCGGRAGWRWWCSDCRALWKLWQENRGRGMRRILIAFEDAGIDRDQIERFMAGEPRPGQGAIRDHIAAEMANQLLDALGRSATQDARKTRRLRDIGAWRDYDRRPEE